MGVGRSLLRRGGWGCRRLGGDLNPVAVLISKALVEIPPRFEGLGPVNPDARDRFGSETWERAQGLAEDIGFYGGVDAGAGVQADRGTCTPTQPCRSRRVVAKQR